MCWRQLMSGCLVHWYYPSNVWVSIYFVVSLWTTLLGINIRFLFAPYYSVYCVVFVLCWRECFHLSSVCTYRLSSISGTVIIVSNLCLFSSYSCIFSYIFVSLIFYIYIFTYYFLFFIFFFFPLFYVFIFCVFTLFYIYFIYLSYISATRQYNVVYCKM